MVKRKGGGFTTSTYAHISVLTSSGILKATRPTLSTLRRDRIATEQKRAKEVLDHTNAIHQALIESALQIGADPGAVSADYDAFGVPDVSTAVADDNEQEDDEDFEDLEDGGAEAAARNAMVNCLNGKPARSRRKDYRTRLQKNRQLWSAWEVEIPALTQSYLQWKHSGGSESATSSAVHVFDVSVVSTFDYTFRRGITQLPGESANTALLRVGLLGCSPVEPTVAIDLQCLELFNQIRRRQSLFSTQTMARVLCALHNVTYRQTFRNQLSIAFDVYLNVLRCVQSQVDNALGRSSPSWSLRHGCPPCANKIDGEPLLSPARMHGMDGNNSLKRMTGSGHADERTFVSPLFLSPEEVDIFKDDVKKKPGKETGAKKKQRLENSQISEEISCAERWSANKANAAADETVHIFEQTGIFLSACRHGLVETVAEMRHSGELAKYALCTVNKLMQELGEDQTIGHDIACSFTATLRDSSLSDKVKTHRLTMSVNAFHGHAHNRMCQLGNHPLYRITLGLEDLETCERVFSASNAVARTIRFSSYFHWQQFLDLHFKQWNEDRYCDLSKFLYNNYQQALKILADFTPQLEAYKRMHNISDADIQSWPGAELIYLKASQVEPEKDAAPVAYVEALQALKAAETNYRSLLGVQFVATPEDMRSIVKRRTDAQRRLEMAMTAVTDLEALLSIDQPWQENSKEYLEVLSYINQRAFIRAVCELEGLVVQRLFELSKANLAGTGYKMRQHISKALVRRSAAIKSSLERYNRLAVKQNPPRPKLEYSDIVTYCLLGEFEFLKDSRYGVLNQPWTLPANREITTKYFKTLCAHTEITRLNVEIARLQDWVDKEDNHFQAIANSLATSNPILASEVRQQCARHHRMNNIHRARLRAIYMLRGYSGGHPNSQINASDSSEDQMTDEDLNVGDSVLIDEDDTLNEEGVRLDETMERMSLLS